MLRNCSIALLLFVHVAAAQTTQPFKALTWRPLGPANMSGRITDLAVVESDPSMYWIATASGGLLKTINNGVTFEHQFDKQTTVSIGAVAVSQSNPKIVWVGTGENNPRNSVSYGDGVYKSVDGGKTWKNMGLKNSFQIGRIIIHPTDPNVVYIGALGRLYGPNEERGLFKTTNGGESWERVLYIDNKTGVIDMIMSPADPNVLLVAMWERMRDGFDSDLSETMRDGYNRYDPVVKWGPGSGIFKTSDGGKSFRRVTSGLPTNPMGRIGLDVYRKDPNVMFAIIDCEKIGMGPPPKARTGSNVYAGINGEDGEEGGVKVTMVAPDSPAQKAGIETGDIIQSLNETAVARFDSMVEEFRARKVGDVVKVKLVRDEKPMTVDMTLAERPAGGGRFGGGGGGGGGGGRGAPSNAYIGVTGEDSEAGARIVTVVREGPAAKAALKQGDVLLKIGDTRINRYRDVTDSLREKQPGDIVKVEIDRAGERLAVDVTLGTREVRDPMGGSFGPGGATPTRPYTASYGGQAENMQDQQNADGKGHEYGGLYRSYDAGESWVRINSINPRPMYFSVVKVDPSDEKNIYVLGVSQYRSADGGKTFRADFGRNVHADGHALWINPRDGRHMLIGCDGGTYATYDRGQNWDMLNHTAIGQFYHVDVCPRMPYWVTGGLQDNGCWAGPAMNPRNIAPINEDWLSVAGGDGYVCRFDANDPDLIYFEAQNGAMGRRNMRTGERATIRPRPPEGAPPYRFNWNTPYILSKANSKIFYCGGNYVFRSLDRGDNLQVISPEITATKWGSATALSESPKNPEVLYVGTDDGALWVTRDGGKNWTDITKRVGLPQLRWVASIEASRFEEGRCYVAFDGHRSDDDESILYVTEDFGQSWKSIRGNLPRGSTRVLREDINNPNLLFCGTEFAAWCSLDRGKSWQSLNTNLPTVAIHEFAFHPTCGEVVVATHGRSLWALDVSALRQIKPEEIAKAPQLFQPMTATRWQPEPGRGRTNRRFVATNPPSGANIYYSLPKKATDVTLKIVDIEGKTVREIKPSPEAGLNKITWDLQRTSTGGGARTGAQSDRFTRAGTRPTTRFTATRPATTQTALATTQPTTRAAAPGRGGQPVAPGAYRLVLTVDGVELSRVIQVRMDPNQPEGVTPADELEEEISQKVLDREQREIDVDALR